MGKTLHILYRGDPLLDTPAETVENISSKQTQELIDNMIHTCSVVSGAGLAAPQVNVSKRIIIISDGYNERYGEDMGSEPLVMINPEMTSFSDEMESGWEGCLSIPMLRGLVPRHTEIEISYLDRDGSRHERTLSGFTARVFQHELDHLNGIMFPSRVKDINKLMSDSEFKFRVEHGTI